MTDIVERLRYTAQIRGHSRTESDLVLSECLEAAAEIDRLRASERSAWNAAVVRDEQIDRLKAENERLTKAMEPDAVGRLIYETWLKAANGPEWVSFDDLAHFAPDDRVAIEQIVAALRARAALTPAQGGEQ